MAQQVQDPNKYTAVRLPGHLAPSNYDLFIDTDLKECKFRGTVKIDYSITGPKSDGTPITEVVLHSKYIEITDGHVEDSQGIKRPLVKVTYSEGSETATLDFGSEGGDIFKNGQIYLEFNGTINDQMRGYYKSCYKVKNSQGQDVEITAATSQFEPVHARWCLPCWDEPAFKATFEVSLAYDPNIYKNHSSTLEVVALSNTQVVSKKQVDDKVIVKYAKSPKMSSYLLAFVVGAFEYIEQNVGNKLIRVYTSPGKIEQGRYALEVAGKSLQFYEKYFNIEYPLQKMDLIAIPDFSNGAMENWGLITYRETCLLVDPQNTSTAAKHNVALVVAHEIAHQWFGNLVTMEWWTHLWLNEGFATFMEYFCVNQIYPEYDIWSQFIADSHSRALELDALHNSHPIEVPIHNPDEIDEIFDLISYEKGSSVIHMLHNYIGDDSFRIGMSNYLNKFAYKNAQTEDLWAALEEASKKPVCKLMQAWTLKKGYPFVTVSDGGREGDNVKLNITQCKFSADGKLLDEDEAATWFIPISTVNGSNPNVISPMTLLEGKSGQIVVKNAGDSWIKLNPGTISFYRTLYSPEMTSKLWPAISNQTLEPMDRLGIQDDFFKLCEAGKVDSVNLLKLLSAFKTETNYTVWASIDACVGKLNLILSDTDFIDKYHAYAQNLYLEILKKLTWQPKANEKDTDIMNRSLVINRLISLNHSETIQEAQRIYKENLEKIESIPADLRFPIYKAVSRYGNSSEFDSLFALHKRVELQEEKNRAARALAYSKDPERLQRVIKFALSDDIRDQDKASVVASLGVNNPQIGWELLQEQKDYFRKIYGNTNLIRAVIKHTTENFACEKKAEEISKFFEKNKFPGAERTIQQSLEKIRINASWLVRDKEALRTFLSTAKSFIK